MKNKIRLILIICLSMIFVFSAFNIIRITTEYQKNNKEYTKLQDKFVEETNSANNTVTPPISINFQELLKENSNIIGWLYCPNTPINYPVVQGEDNTQYLHADLKGKYLSGGTIFADYRNNSVGKDKNLIIYGHNMKNSTMFGTLDKYKNPSYYDAHPILYFLTPDNNYIIELVAGTVVKQDSDIYTVTPNKEIVDAVTSKSTFNSSVEITYSTNLITLSTCSYEFNDARYVLLGILRKI